MKPNRVLCAALAIVPAALAAQAPAPQANPVMQSYRAYATHYGNWLVAAFDSIPAGKYDYKPTPVQQSVGYIAQHLEDANYQLCAPMSGATHTMNARDSLADTVKALWPKDTLVARLKASLEFCDKAMAGLNDGQLGDDIPVGPPASGRKISRARYLLAFETDLAEHYSQLAGYMRLNGMVPPSARPRPAR